MKPKAIGERRRKWWRTGVSSLADQPRCRLLSKLTHEYRQLPKEWLEAETLTCRAWGRHLTTACGVTISASLAERVETDGLRLETHALQLKKYLKGARSEIPSGSK